jgi:hypothetical protein
VNRDGEFLGSISSATSGFTIQVDEWPKSLELAADDGNHQWQSKRTGANE